MHEPSFSLRVLALAFALGLAASQQAQAQAQEEARPTGEIAISEDSLQLRYIDPRSGEDAPGGAAGELGLGLFFSENRDFVASAHYYAHADRLGFRGLTILVGPVAYGAMLSRDNSDVFAVALGAEARYELLRRPELTIVGRAAYAPDILTFGSGDNLWDIVVRAEMPITDRIVGFGGYRLFEVDLLVGNEELEESIHLGLRYRF